MDQLDDETVSEVFAYLQWLKTLIDTGEDTARSRLNKRMGPTVVSGKEFMASASEITYSTLAEQQLRRPVGNLDDFMDDPWSEDEAREFDEWFREIRGRGRRE